MYCSPAIFPTFRRHLRISFAAAFVTGIILLFTSPAQADPERTIIVPPQLLEWKQEVEDKQATLASHYDYKPAPITLHAAFDKGGVDWAKRYTSSWGSWVYTDWDVAKRLHKRTHRKLQDAINQHKSAKPIRINQFDDLRKMMRNFRIHNATYTQLFQERIDYNVKQALELDDKHVHELAKYAASAAGNSVLAEFHQSMMDHYAARAEVLRNAGGNVSKKIRDIGYGKTTAPATAALPRVTDTGVAISPIIIR